MSLHQAYGSPGSLLDVAADESNSARQSAHAAVISGV